MPRLAVILFALLGGCSTVTPAPLPPASGPCNDSGLGAYLSQPASADLGARMLAQSGARILRWVPYGSAVTMEFSPERLTVSLDRQNRVEGAHCG